MYKRKIKVTIYNLTVKIVILNPTTIPEVKNRHNGVNFRDSSGVNKINPPRNDTFCMYLCIKPNTFTPQND